MSMSRVKNIIILALLVVNLGLFGLLYLENRKFTLAKAQSDSIVRLLSQNEIGLYSEFISDVRPLRQLSVSRYSFSPEEIKSLFFGGADFTAQEAQNNIITYSSEGKTVKADSTSKRLIFDDPEGTGKIEFSALSAEKLCQEYVDNFNKLGFNLKKEKSFLQEGNPEAAYYYVDYRTVYNDSVIYPSRLRFKVTSHGIIQIQAALVTVNGYKNDARKIYSNAEALFVLLYELKSTYGDANAGIIIREMDIVYYFNESDISNDDDSGFIASPAYRFNLSANIGGEKTLLREPILINCYTNNVLGR